MEHYVIYSNPKDYPGRFVTRRFVISPGKMTPQECFLADSLENARLYIPPQFENVGRDWTDDPVIVETWI